jgi:hypothetical protein
MLTTHQYYYANLNPNMPAKKNEKEHFNFNFTKIYLRLRVLQSREKNGLE